MDARELVKQISDRVDIVEQIGRVVPLKRVGKSFRSLCPFHQDKDPSFYVHPHSKRFFCYGCKAGGDIVNFVQRHRGISFVEACEALIQENGLAIAMGGAKKTGASKKRDLEPDYKVNDFAARFYARALARVPEAQRYLMDARALTEETIRYFCLGASAWDQKDALWATLSRKAASQADAERYREAAARGGLVNRRGAMTEDRFWRRVMIPIRDFHGRVVGFGSRGLSSDPNVPKYLNSPESDLFQKRNHLYGFFENSQQIRVSREMFLVEGYFDVITLWQNGVKNACATMGTTLSDAWIKRLKRLLKRLVIVFDGDDAGIDAMVKHAPAFFKIGWEPEVMILPEAQDPDSFVARHGGEAFLAESQKARRYLDFYFLERLRKSEHSYFETMNLFDDIVNVLAAAAQYEAAAVRLDQYLGLADLGHDVRASYMSTLKSHYLKTRAGGSARPAPKIPADKTPPIARGLMTELRLLYLAMYDTEYIDQIANIPQDMLKEALVCDLIALLSEYKEVLTRISAFEDRLEFIRHSFPANNVSGIIFDVLKNMDRRGLSAPASRREMYARLLEILKDKKNSVDRRRLIADFKQQYSGGRMSWDEVLGTLGRLQGDRAKTDDKLSE